MSNDNGMKLDGKRRRRRLPIHKLKKCPLCQAVNATQNSSCFVCGWHGTFSHDPHDVYRGLDALMERCPELEMILDTPEPSQKLSSKIRRSLGRIFRKRLDLRA